MLRSAVRCRLRELILVLLVTGSVTAQPQFEAASVKRTERCQFNTSITPGFITLNGVPLKVVLTEAFQVKMDQIEGPSWLDTECVEISAKIPEGVSKDQVPTMLQALLTERFKLADHIEDRPNTGYALVVDKNGPKCKPDDSSANFMGRLPQGSVKFGFAGSGQLKGVMTMAELAKYVSGRGYGPVQDATGLTGKYDIELSWTPDPAFEPKAVDSTASAGTSPAADIPAPEPNFFTALREVLGLKLEHRRVQIRFLVIDHIERIPTGN